MRKRVLVSKTFDSGVISQAVLSKGMTLSKGIMARFGLEKKNSNVVFFLSNVPEQVSLNCDIQSAKSFFESDDVLHAFVISDGDCGFKMLSQQCRGGDLFSLVDSDEKVRKSLIKLGTSLFGKTNPLTGNKDVLSSDTYAPYIPLVVVSGALPPQLDISSNTYFNPKGSVEVARALDSLNALCNGCYSNKNRHDSIDMVSNTVDFYNEGYNKCLDTFASPFFRLFTRSELMSPITLAELAYIIVVCFEDFKKIYGTVRGFSDSNKFQMGITLDWEHPKKIIKQYRKDFLDMNDYVVTRCSEETYTSEDEVKSVLDIDIKKYTNGRTMTDFRQDLLSGKSALPLPYLMSILELHQMGIFSLGGSELLPLKEVSRGEFAEILVALASKLY